MSENYISKNHPNVDYSKYADNPQWHEYLKYAGGDNEFALFLAFTDKRCMKLIGVDLFSLEDSMIRDMFDNGDTPQQAAVATILNDSLYSEMIGFEPNTGEYY